MEASYPNQLRLWQGPAATAVQDLFGPPGDELVRSSGEAETFGSDPADMAGQLFACEALKPSWERREADDEGEPYSLQWFLNIESHRHGRHARWIPRLLEFTKHRGETLLGLGHGLGTDWIQYARHGAAVIVCSACPSQLELVRRNFQLRGLAGKFLFAPADALPLKNNSIDVACISGLLQQAECPAAVVEEVYRVLKPGGKVIAVTPAKYDVDYWRDKVFFWNRWLGLRRRAEEEVQRRFTARRLKRLFADFEEHKVKKRQLRRREVPHPWRMAPLPILERLFGHVLVIKAFKPISAAFPAQAAA